MHIKNMPCFIDADSTHDDEDRTSDDVQAGSSRHAGAEATALPDIRDAVEGDA